MMAAQCCSKQSRWEKILNNIEEDTRSKSTHTHPALYKTVSKSRKHDACTLVWCICNPGEEQQEPPEKRVGLKRLGFFTLFTHWVTSPIIELLFGGVMVVTVGDMVLYLWEAHELLRIGENLAN